MGFVVFRGIHWPEKATDLLKTSVADVHAWRDHLVAKGAAPKTLNRRIASLSSFYKYLQAEAAELRLTTTQIYDKRRRTAAEGASYDMPI